MDEDIAAIGNHSIAAAGIVNSIITTGPNSPIFSGTYEKLRDAIILPLEVFDRVHINQFVGRDWLAEKIDSILRDNDRGYIVLEADAGLGKTAFLAWLIKERNYVHHFTELAPGQEGIEKGLKNLAAQLILAYQLSPDEVIPNASARPDYLYRLLSKAAEKIKEEERIVVVVDALDEAGSQLSQNTLGLPQVLPKGVFIIVSKRPVRVALHIDQSTTQRWLLKIIADSNENLEDMRHFLDESTTWFGINKALKDSGYSPENYSLALMEKCQGVWIYLNFVVHEIENGERSPLNLDTLPDGLQQYYSRYWLKWREKDEWYDVYLPLLTTLAVAQEAVNLDGLIEWSGIKIHNYKFKLRNILKEQWRPFLVVTNEGPAESYRFYHATVREFFNGKTDLDKLLADEKSFVCELADATKDRHKHVSLLFLDSWGGLDRGLCELETKKDIDRYWRNHLVFHLEMAGLIEELHSLLKLETGLKQNLWYEIKDSSGDISGYISDVLRAWRCAEERWGYRENLQDGKIVGLQNRYALILATINSISANVPSNLLIKLIKNDLWTKEKGLAYARQVPDPSQRIKILILLSNFFMEQRDVLGILGEALQAFGEIDYDEGRAEAIHNIITILSTPQDMLSIARDMDDLGSRADALTDIASVLTGPLQTDVLKEALDVCEQIVDEWYRAFVLSNIVPLLPDLLQENVLRKVLDIIRKIDKNSEEIKNYSCASTLINIVQYLSDPQQAIAIAENIKNKKNRVIALCGIASYLSSPVRNGIMIEAIETAREIKDNHDRSDAISRVIPLLADNQKALGMLSEISNECDRSNALSNIASKMEDPQEALDIARELGYEKARIRAFSEIAPLLTNTKRDEVLREALVLTRNIHDGGRCANALSTIAVHFPKDIKDSYLKRALAIARGETNDCSREYAISNIAPILSDPQESFRLIKEIKCEYYRAYSLRYTADVHLSDHYTERCCQEALAIAKEVQDEYRRMHALCGILPLISGPLKDNLLKEAIEECQEISDDKKRAKTLSIIAPLFPDSLKERFLREALEVSRRIPDEWARSGIISAIVSLLSDSTEALAISREINREDCLADALSSIAPRLANPQDALTLALDIQIPEYRYFALSNIAPLLPEHFRYDLLEDAIKMAHEIEDPWARATAISYIAPLLSQHPGEEMILEITFESIAKNVDDDCCRANSFSRIVEMISEEETTKSYPLWCRTLHTLARRTREDLLMDISSLMPLVMKLGGQDALIETAEAIKDIQKWWP